MAGIRDELGNLFRPMGESEAENADSASRMRALSGLASLLRAAEEARKSRRADKNDPAAADSPTPSGSAPSGSNVVRLTIPART